MKIVKIIGDFLLSSWIWNITFDWYHPIVTGIVMFCLLHFVMHRRYMQSLAISLMTQFFSFGLLAAKVIFVFIRMLGWQYEPLAVGQAVEMMNTFMPSLYVGILYALFQSIFFIIGRCIWRFNLRSFVVMTWVSNGFGVIISYMLINMTELYYYIG